MVQYIVLRVIYQFQIWIKAYLNLVQVVNSYFFLKGITYLGQIKYKTKKTNLQYVSIRVHLTNMTWAFSKRE